MLYRFKGQFQKLVEGLLGGNGTARMTPNQATVLGCVSVLLIAAALFEGIADPNRRFLLLLIPFFLFFRLAMNALDGLLARRMGIATPAGEYLNEFTDVLGDTVSYGVLYFVEAGPRFSVLLFLVSIWACEFAGVLGKAMPGGSRRQDSILGGKSERALWMGIAALSLYFRPDLLNWLPAYLCGVSGFVAISAWLRAVRGIRAVPKDKYVSHTAFGK